MPSTLPFMRTSLSRGKSAGIVVTLWILFVLGKAGLAALF